MWMATLRRGYAFYGNKVREPFVKWKESGTIKVPRNKEIFHLPDQLLFFVCLFFIYLY